MPDTYALLVIKFISLEESVIYRGSSVIISMKRRGALPPALIAIITIAAIGSAVLVAWFMWSTTQRATKQCVLVVKGNAPSYDPTGKKLYFTLQNTGTKNCTLTAVSAVLKGKEATCSGPALIEPGETGNYVCDFSTDPPADVEDGAGVIIRTDEGQVQASVSTP